MTINFKKYYEMTTSPEVYSKPVYLICEPHLAYGSRGELLIENTEQVLFCFNDKEKAVNKLKELNSTIEEEEGDLPFFIKRLPLE